MPRNSSGVYILPNPAFVPNTIISSAVMNSDLGDIATALTQSLATTGVSSMTGPIKAADGSLTNPSYAFAADTNTGFYRIGDGNIGWAANGALGASFNASLSVTWYGGATWAGDIVFSSSVSVVSNVRIGGNASVSGNLNVYGTGANSIGGAQSIVDIASGGVVVSTVSVNFNRYLELQQVVTPASAAANATRIYIAERSINANSGVPFAEDENGYKYPLGANNGQCVLYKSGTSLLLAPYGGNSLMINGVPQPIPDLGVSLAASNSAATFVYIYAYMNAATMALEMSTTAPALQTGTGISQKSGDSTRTLVGAAFTDAGGAWADTDGKLWVLSFYNRRLKKSRTIITASLSTITAGYIEVDASMRNQFIMWSNPVPTVARIKSALWINKAGAGGSIGYSNHNIDGTTPLDGLAINLIGIGTNGQSVNHTDISGLTEAANHYATIYAASDATNTIVCSIGASAQNSTYIYVEVDG